MARHGRQLAESGIYHVMLRGVNRDAIFLEDEDHEQFLRVLRLVKGTSGCQYLAYCLMTNHVHLVVRVTDEPISVVLKRIGVRYAGWFNHRYGRVGHLFQDRFASRPVEDDAYLLTLLRYVWRNPVDAGLVERAEDYPWSSRRLLGRGPTLIDEDALTHLVPREVLDELAAAASAPSGETVIEPGVPARCTIDEAAAHVLRACGAQDPEDFQRLNHGTQRRVVGELRTRGVSYAQIATLTGLSPSSVRRLHVSAPPPTCG